MKFDVVGVIPLFSGFASILFDSGASHSFVSSSFVKAHDLKMEVGIYKWHVWIPTGETQVSRAVCKRCPLTQGYLNMPTDLVVVEMNDFDVILGMDWLSEHHAFIDRREKRVIFEIPNQRTYCFQGIRTQTLVALSTLQVCHMKKVVHEGYLVSLQGIEK